MSAPRFRRGQERRRAGVAADPDVRDPSGKRRQLGIDSIPLFRGAEVAAVLDAIGDCEVLLLAADTTLLAPGEPNDTIYLVLSGELAVHLDRAGKTEHAIPIRPGECLGELSVIDGKPVSALVTASIESRVLRLPQAVFWDRLITVPGVTRNLLVVLAARMRRNTEVMLEGQRRRIELEHLRQELDLARQLQLGMLPIGNPMFPDRNDVEVAGMMEAASAVGGDLFDAFFVDEQRLFFCIGDVSGHGIPAAMFMARTVSLLRIAAFSSDCPAVLLGRVNEQMCAGNDANLFVTLFCGFLQVDSGHIVYSNAGHLAPVLLRNGTSTALELPKGTIIGVLPGIRYRRCEVTLHAGDALLCFTDGVTEAQTVAGEEFAEPRLHELIRSHGLLPLPRMLELVREEVAHFSGTRELADDCTLLALRRPVSPLGRVNEA